MKKLLVLVLFCLSSVLAFAQKASPTTHWTSVNDEDNMTMYAVLVIDGTEIGMEATTQYEIGVFDQNGDCRCAKFGKKKGTGANARYIYPLTIKGHAGLVNTFRVWDHVADAELEAVYMGEPIEFVANATIAPSSNPAPVEFTTAATPTFYLPITGYGEGNNYWYLIASPIGEVAPDAVDGMIDQEPENYDLFRFNQSAAMAWENYKKEGEHQYFNLEAGKGYLYASKYDVQLAFTGVPYSGDGVVDLAYDATSPFAGYNLIGNPFADEAMLEKPFYRMNEDGSAFAASLESNVVAAMEGVLVQATEEGEQVTFVPSDKAGAVIPTTNIMVSSNNKVVDNAIVRFDEGATLGKIQLNENSTKIYVPQNGKDYAIVNATAGEMPLNFKAETTGTYTLSFKLSEANVGYLHLFDKATGEDIDLLIDHEYSFVGSPRDNEDRFIIRFSEVAANDIFVYQNGDQLIVNGEGQLQVFDVMGRYVAAYDVNGNMSISASQFSNAVYVFRMVGTDVKTQKIVVR